MGGACSGWGSRLFIVWPVVRGGSRTMVHILDTIIPVSCVDYLRT